jgi:hypothetical protein
MHMHPTPAPVLLSRSGPPFMPPPPPARHPCLTLRRDSMTKLLSLPSRPFKDTPESEDKDGSVDRYPPSGVTRPKSRHPLPEFPARTLPPCGPSSSHAVR